MGVAERRVHQHEALVLPHGLCEALGTFGDQNVTQSFGRLGDWKLESDCIRIQLELYRNRMGSLKNHAKNPLP